MSDPSAPRRITNVASVPQRSPFRYPGGKTWLVPHIRTWLRSLKPRPRVLVEPFAGGAIVGLTAGFERLVERVELVELDEDVAAVWSVVLGKPDDAAWLCDRIASFDVNPESVRRTLAEPIESVRERAFRTILKNRTYHKGIMARGSSLIKKGEQGRGIRSRWYPETLCRRIAHIQEMRTVFQFHHGDGLARLEMTANKPDHAFFIDPPYTAGAQGKRAGKRLYQHNDLDHERLFHIASQVSGDLLMTYDQSDEVLNLARRHGFEVESIPMKNTHHNTMTELIIGRNLDWFRRDHVASQPRLF